MYISDDIDMLYVPIKLNNLNLTLVLQLYKS